MDTLSPSKLKIISAAAQVTQRLGAGNLTLDRVAEEAGVSKGGLLYHYASKRALLEGMLGYLLAQMEARLVQPREDRELNDYILLDAQPSVEERAISQVLLAAAAEDPELMNPARQFLEQLLADAQKHSREAILLLLAAEGLRFMDILNLLPDSKTRNALFSAIASRAKAPQR